MTYNSFEDVAETPSKVIGNAVGTGQARVCSRWVVSNSYNLSTPNCS